MKKIFVGVRDVDAESFRKFRVVALAEKMKIGKALSLALERFVAERRKKEEFSFFKKVKPFDWGVGGEKISEEIDGILYGGDDNSR